MDIKNDSPIRAAVTAPVTPPEVIVIPSYDTPGDVFPDWKPLPAPAAPPRTVAPPAPPVVKPAPVPELAPVEVAEPDTGPDYVAHTFDDHFATGLLVARYVLFAAITGLVGYGAYAMLSTVAGNVALIAVVVAVIAGLGFLGVRLRGALSAASQRSTGAVLPASDIGIGQRTAGAGASPRGAGAPGGTVAAVRTAARAVRASAGATVGTVAGALTHTPADTVTGVSAGRGAYDELTGTYGEWDGVSTPTGPSLAELNAQAARQAQEQASGYGVPAGRTGFTGEVKRGSLSAPRTGFGLTVPPSTGLRSMAAATLFGTGTSPVAGVAGTAALAGVAAPGAEQSLSLDAQRAIATGGLVSRSGTFGTSVAGAGVAPEGFLTSMWVAEMRSGRHQQVRGVLRDSGLPADGTGLCRDALCARGLLYNTAMPSGWFWRREGPTSGWGHVMSRELNDRYGDIAWHAEYMNDILGSLWPEIADWVEQNSRV